MKHWHFHDMGLDGTQSLERTINGFSEVSTLDVHKVLVLGMPMWATIQRRGVEVSSCDELQRYAILCVNESDLPYIKGLWHKCWSEGIDEQIVKPSFGVTYSELYNGLKDAKTSSEYRIIIRGAESDKTFGYIRPSMQYTFSFIPDENKHEAMIFDSLEYVGMAVASCCLKNQTPILKEAINTFIKKYGEWVELAVQKKCGVTWIDQNETYTTGPFN